MRWLEVSLTVSGELIEPVAELLQRVASEGVAVTPAQRSPSSISERSKANVRAYLPVDAQMRTSQEEIRRGLAHLGMISPLPDPQFNIIEEEDWLEAWKSHYRPLPVGDRLIIIPSWHSIEAPRRMPIRLDPGMAFGTGTHPTTQMCLRALEEQIKADMLVVDVGCGSGILSIAAAVLGARRVLAVDTDEDAVAAASHNVQENRVGSVVQVHHGSLDLLLELMQADAEAADITVTNILSRVIIEMLEGGLTNTLQGDGLLLLSGVLDQQVDSVMAACERQGLIELKRYSQADWRALLLRNGRPNRSGRSVV